jgi:glycogen debranching enzyme
MAFRGSLRDTFLTSPRVQLRKLAFHLFPALVAGAWNVSALEPLPRFPIAPGPLAITRPVEPGKPFTVAGPRGAILGEQGGGFEAWQYPLKILSHFRITGELADYPVPLDISSQAATIEVTPAVTTITYSHAAFTVRQRMFATRGDSAAAVVVLFEIDAVRPMRLTFEFKPEMQRMWPAPNFGAPNAEWVANGGYYVLHTDNPEISAAIAMPRATPGVLPPYQERPKTYPVELKLAFDPKTDSKLCFPLIIASTANTSGIAAALEALHRSIPELYRQTEDYYAHFFDRRLTVDTPDATFDRALRWAEIAIDQGKVALGAETGLIAGYYESGDSARPGYAWFFGRDALWTSYALNSYGDFGSTRQALEFLIRRQRADGKIMHEYSQTAGLLDWKSTPYFYASADSTPLFVMAMEDYVDTSADVSFLKSHWDAVKRAYAFTRAHDSDGDGIYENTEGTGWVESWPSGMPHQEIYLAALDQQSADAMSRLAALMNDAPLSAEAGRKAAEIRAKLEPEYYATPDQFYAFSRNADGRLDRTATIYPAVAWWSGRLALPRADAMLARWASPEFSTDWGTRDISNRTAFYDPISYHQGSVWPLFTGWVSLAEYRAGRALAGYRHLMENAGLTWMQDLGAVTELLSGEFFQPLGRSSSHQVWSSAMVLTPALRGMFGLDWGATHRTLRLAPNLPATWDTARLHNVALGDSRIDLDFMRENGRLIVKARSAAPIVLCLVAQSAARDQNCGTPAAATHDLALPLPAVELGIPGDLPLPGARTTQLKVTGEHRETNRYEVTLEALGGSTYALPVRLNRPGVRSEGGEIADGKVQVRFPAGEGYRRASLVFTW